MRGTGQRRIAKSDQMRIIGVNIDDPVGDDRRGAIRLFPSTLTFRRLVSAPIIADRIVYVYTNDAHLIAFGDPALWGTAHPSQPRIHHKAKPKPGEIVKDKRGFFSTPDWVPVF